MAEYASQSVSHAFIAALVTEALLRLWRVGDPDVRVAFRVLPIVFPLAVLPAFMLLAPERSGEWFVDHRALFAGARWGDLTPGARLDSLGVTVLAALGVILFVRDLVPFFSRQLRRVDGRSAGSAEDDVAVEVATIARAMGTAPPRVVVVETALAVFLVRGARCPTLVVSRGALDRLDPEERRVALAHEVAHVSRRDPLLGWALMACRALTLFNPVCQVIVRAITRELEWRADDLAARATGARLPLAAALVKLHRAQEAAPPADRWLARLLAWGRATAVEIRCRRLLAPPVPPTVPLAGLKLGLTGLALGALLFFVV